MKMEDNWGTSENTPHNWKIDFYDGVGLYTQISNKNYKFVDISSKEYKQAQKRVFKTLSKISFEQKFKTYCERMERNRFLPFNFL